MCERDLCLQYVMLLKHLLMGDGTANRFGTSPIQEPPRGECPALERELTESIPKLSEGVSRKAGVSLTNNNIDRLDTEHKASASLGGDRSAWKGSRRLAMRGNGARHEFRVPAARVRRTTNSRNVVKDFVVKTNIGTGVC
jgi:hypothetical protein